MYLMRKIILSLANHVIPKKFLPNCGMWDVLPSMEREAAEKIDDMFKEL
jgi:hypothetical protein